MRTVAETDLNGYKNFISVNSTAENTTLNPQSIDFVVVGQAFHWFDRELFKAECSRILKPGGKVILVWNSRIFGTEAVEDGEKINRKYCPNFKGFDNFMRGMEDEKSRFNDFFMGEYDFKIFNNDTSFDLNEFIGRTLSASYALKEHDENYSDYITELTACFNKHAVDGRLVMSNDTRSYAGQVENCAVHEFDVG
jgi:SAM-dependent methyltransferase